MHTMATPKLHLHIVAEVMAKDAVFTLFLIRQRAFRIAVETAAAIKIQRAVRAYFTGSSTSASAGSATKILLPILPHEIYDYIVSAFIMQLFSTTDTLPPRTMPFKVSDDDDDADTGAGAVLPPHPPFAAQAGRTLLTRPAPERLYITGASVANCKWSYSGRVYPALQ